MYVGSVFAPISLVGLLLKGSVVASVAPATSVSVIVPVYNGASSIENCIKSIIDQSIRPTQIIVTDDFSTDRTPRILERLQHKYSNLKVIRNSENLGKAASVTKALDHVTAAHTAVVDSDTYLNKNYLASALGTFKENVVGAHGMVMPTNTDSIVAKNRLLEYLHGQATYKKIHDRIGVSFVAPGCCAVWRTDWLQKNGVPTDTVVEDMDLTWDAQDGGNRIAYAPEAIAYTEEPDTFRQFLRQTKRWFSWRPVIEKHASTMTTGLKALVAWMMAESICYLISLGAFFLALFSGDLLMATMIFGVDFAIIVGIAIYQGKKMDYDVWQIVKAIPSYYLLRIPTMLIFWSTLANPMRSGW